MLFKDEYDEAAVAAEGKVLEERERYGQEELPEGAHKANKHYEPWKEEFKKDSQGVFKGQEFKDSRISTSAASTSSTASTAATSTTSAAQDNYLGIPYGEIIKKWWQMYNDGQEPMRSNRNTLTFELADFYFCCFSLYCVNFFYFNYFCCSGQLSRDSLWGNH